MDDLSGRTVLLTGASRGIGAATARILGEAGADVVAHYGGHRQGAAEAVAGLGPGRSLLLQADLAQPGSGRELWRRAVAWKGRVDVLVVNAAVMPETPWDATDEDWDHGWETAMRVNVLEPASLVREAVRHWLAQGGGTLVTLSSWAAQRGSAIPQLPAYAASKSAVKALTQTVARNHAADGILAYVVAPGIVRTRLSEISAATRGGIDAVNAGLAMGEMVPADEVGRLVAWLATGSCRHLTGATLDVNGASYIR
ncbi:MULTISPECIES: SDR family NAD(P)-dependent oxidoreductase [unclassified Blastococcus]|uniref:SDR family NAD(P)-dependent oxidoreductase n=1 Tax=unclassified Blastococcus TaxID=2619396 RepID=UPI001EF15B41|nr:MULTISPECIES: SDR family oxidoreductase [unclassified Blastococcus]